jgi:hypothetical protein
MPITNNNVRILDRKQWEMVNPAPATNTAGSFVASSDNIDQIQFYMSGPTNQYLYRPDEDGWQQVPSAGFASLIAGTAGTYHIYGPSGTASSGNTSNTINVSISSPGIVPGQLSGFKIRLTGGTGAGQERTITGNTYNTSAITITVDTAWTVVPDATTTYVILSGRFYVFNAGAANTFKYYDIATNAWSAALSVTNVPAFATDGKLKATYGTLASNIFATGTATAGSTTTLTNGAKAWTTNQWTNYQVRITGGTGAGQYRTIASNTGTVLTVAAAFTTAPDTTSTYVIEGNDDFMYLAGNNSTILYRYVISTNTWSVLVPNTNRASAPGPGMSLQWVRSVSDPLWTNENAIINGRRLYSFQGAGTSTLHYYDIPANTWVTLPYQRQMETFNSGTSWDSGGNGKLYCQKDATSRFFQFDIARNSMKALSTLPVAQGGALPGDRLFSVSVPGDGSANSDGIVFIYHMRNSNADTYRLMIF